MEENRRYVPYEQVPNRNFLKATEFKINSKHHFWYLHLQLLPSLKFSKLHFEKLLSKYCGFMIIILQFTLFLIVYTYN